MHLNANHIHTEPGSGAAHPFAPPSGFTGDQQAYKQEMQRLYHAEKLDRGQRMFSFARHYHRDERPVTFHGPYAESARAIVESMRPASFGTPKAA